MGSPRASQPDRTGGEAASQDTLVGGDTQETERSRRPAMAARAVAGFLSSPRLGLVLLAMIFTYLAAASLAPAGLGLSQARAESLYATSPLKVCLWALVINVACASIFRVPFRLSRLGAHLAHLGVIVLAAGAGWYAAGSLSGYAVAHRDPASGLFAPVDRLYLEDSAALYVTAPSPGGARQAEWPLPAWPEGKPVGQLDIAVPSPVTGVSVAVTGYMASAHLESRWADDGPVPSPGVELIVHDGPHRFHRTLCASVDSARRFDADAYALVCLPESDADRLARIAQAPARDIALIVPAGTRRGRVVILRPDGSREERAAGSGQTLSLTLGRRQVKLEVVRFLARARRVAAARPAPPGQAPPAVKLDVEVGEWRGSLWVSRYHSLRPIDPGNPDLQSLPLPGGGRMYFQLAPQYRMLGKALAIAQMRYQTYPDSGIPRDYICALAVLDAAGRPAERLECRLNQPVDVGRFRLYQSEWRPEPENPTEVIFLVRARPGIWAVWLGCGLICAGIPYGFYVKPLLLRRARRARP